MDIYTVVIANGGFNPGAQVDYLLLELCSWKSCPCVHGSHYTFIPVEIQEAAVQEGGGEHGVPTGPHGEGPLSLLRGPYCGPSQHPHQRQTILQPSPRRVKGELSLQTTVYVSCHYCTR